jgi:hypothetical protein
MWFRLWIFISSLWVLVSSWTAYRDWGSSATVEERIAQIVFILLPPLLLYPAGAAIGRSITGMMPLHIQRGLFRLYIAIGIPWAVWFGYAATTSGSRALRLHAINALFLVPLGAPLLCMVVLWIAAGFRSPLQPPQSDPAPLSKGSQPPLPPTRTMPIQREQRRLGTIILAVGCVAYVLAIAFAFARGGEAGGNAVVVLLSALILSFVTLGLTLVVMSLGGIALGPMTGIPPAVFLFAAQAVRHNHRGILAGIIGCALLASAVIALGTVIAGR